MYGVYRAVTQSDGGQGRSSTITSAMIEEKRKKDQEKQQLLKRLKALEEILKELEEV